MKNIRKISNIILVSMLFFLATFIVADATAAPISCTTQAANKSLSGYMVWTFAPGMSESIPMENVSFDTSITASGFSGYAYSNQLMSDIIFIGDNANVVNSGNGWVGNIYMGSVTFDQYGDTNISLYNANHDGEPLVGMGSIDFSGVSLNLDPCPAELDLKGNGEDTVYFEGVPGVGSFDVNLTWLSDDIVTDSCIASEGVDSWQGNKSDNNTSGDGPHIVSDTTIFRIDCEALIIPEPSEPIMVFDTVSVVISDNCPDVSNPDQIDSDEDGIGDLCDNCQYAQNPDQADSDGNGIGDVCDDNNNNDYYIWISTATQMSCVEGEGDLFANLSLYYDVICVDAKTQTIEVPDSNCNPQTKPFEGSLVVSIPFCSALDLKGDGLNSLSIESPSNVNLTWSSDRLISGSCIAYDAWSGSKADYSSIGENQYVSSSSTKFSLKCLMQHEEDRWITDDVIVSIVGEYVEEDLPTLDLKANGSDSITSCNPLDINLMWTGLNVTNCQAYGDWTGPKSISGGQSMGLVSSTVTYTLSCYFEGEGTAIAGYITDTVQVVIDPNCSNSSDVDIKANGEDGPLSSNTPFNVNLTWTASPELFDCVASGGWLGSKINDGGENMGSISSSTNFTLTCKNRENVSISDTVQVNIESDSCNYTWQWTDWVVVDCVENMIEKRFAVCEDSLGNILNDLYCVNLPCGLTKPAEESRLLDDPSRRCVDLKGNGLDDIESTDPLDVKITWESTESPCNLSDNGDFTMNSLPSSSSAITNPDAIAKLTQYIESTRVFTLICGLLDSQSDTLSVKIVPDPDPDPVDDTGTVVLTVDPDVVLVGENVGASWVLENILTCQKFGTGWNDSLGDAVIENGEEIITMTSPGLKEFILSCETPDAIDIIETEYVQVCSDTSYVWSDWICNTNTGIQTRNQICMCDGVIPIDNRFCDENPLSQTGDCSGWIFEVELGECEDGMRTRTANCINQITQKVADDPSFCNGENPTVYIPCPIYQEV